MYYEICSIVAHDLAYPTKTFFKKWTTTQFFNFRFNNSLTAGHKGSKYQEHPNRIYLVHNMVLKITIIELICYNLFLYS